jgi:H(+)-translocating pyrophosphatase
MLSNLPIALAIDAYGPISDNAGGIVEMCDLGDEVRERTDALDAAGNTTAAIGKGFAIGSAALVGLALYGAFITRCQNSSGQHKIHSININDPLILTSLIFGAMLPYAFSAMTMRAVGEAALQMVQEVRRQLKANPKILQRLEKPDYRQCVSISTKASLKKMVAPGALVILTPILFGLFLGPRSICGLIPGAIASGIQMAISMSNTGGAWDNAKKYIESNQLVIDGVVRGKKTEEHKAAVIGDTVGDPLKDTSGPSLNILVKLMAIISLVFAEIFTKTGWLLNVLQEK